MAGSEMMTALPPLTIIPAGAGSGKTYTIQKTLADWVTSGQVRPDRIVAVTFTEAAAAEMRDRIRAELTAQGRLEDALLLEQSYISTIHAFGLRILTEFAFDGGFSPRPRLLNDDEEAALMRRALTVAGSADPVMEDLGGYGYAYDAVSGKGPEEKFRTALLHLMNKLRSISRLEEDPALLPYAEALITELYGMTVDGETLAEKLHRAVKCLLRVHPHDLTGSYGHNDTAVKDLTRNYRDLRRAGHREALATDWKLWQRLRKLRTTGMPEDYADLARAVMAAADALPAHPGPLLQALTHVRALMGAGFEALGRHGEKKREGGLLDYTDMLALSHRLFTDNPAVQTLFRERIDCLIIDEFQDTNPLQFALLWQFRQMGVPTLIVGDLKQAIMGFQNADSRLLEALQAQNPARCRPLTGNWRSTPALMAWINEVGSGLFPGQYTRLEPKADYPSTMLPLETIFFEKRGTNGDRAGITAGHIHRLLNCGTETVYDRREKRQRPLRGGDIVVLCPTHARLSLYAGVLRGLGIRTRIAAGGWYESRVVQLACQALAYVADPGDRHAALYLCATELGSHTLESALSALLDGRLPTDPVLTALQPVAESGVDLPVSALLDDVIDRLALYDRISLWPEASQARVNLLRLQHEARQFGESQPEALAAGGYHGFGPKTFLAWLKAVAEIDERNFQPEPRVSDADAVELATWHSAKGREWPVVVVACLENPVYPRLPSFDVAYRDFSNLGGILEQAMLEFSPDFAAPESTAPFLQRLQAENLSSATRLLYVALTRARERLVLEWPEFLVKSKSEKETYWSILKGKTSMQVGKDQMTVGSAVFPCRVVKGATADPVEVGPSAAPRQGWGRVALVKGAVPSALTPDSITPSLLHDEVASAPEGLEMYRFAPELAVQIALPSAERGTLLHACFELGSTPPWQAIRSGQNLSEEEWAALISFVGAFEDWLSRHFAPVSLRKELPILYLSAAGSVTSGIMDLLVETRDGYWIIDHKSDQVDDLATRFASYLPQLQLYCEAVTRACPQKPVLGCGVNWVSKGVVTCLKWQ